MKKFRYRLQALLKVKEHVERERQKEHGTAVRKVIIQKDELKLIDQTRLGTYDEQRDKLVGNLSVAEMLIYSRYLTKLKRDTLTGREFLRALEKDAETRRGKLVEATRDKKIYERLKEKQQDEYNQSMKRLQSKEEDETAIVGYRRKHIK